MFQALSGADEGIAVGAYVQALDLAIEEFEHVRGPSNLRIEFPTWTTTLPLHLSSHFLAQAITHTARLLGLGKCPRNPSLVALDQLSSLK